PRLRPGQRRSARADGQRDRAVARRHRSRRLARCAEPDRSGDQFADPRQRAFDRVPQCDPGTRAARTRPDHARPGARTHRQPRAQGGNHLADDQRRRGRRPPARRRRQVVIRAWWQGLQERERSVLAIGGALVALMLLWAFAWQPLGQARATLATRVAAQRDDLAQMRAISGDVADLRARGIRGGADRQGKSLLALADVTARDEKADLAAALKRVEPAGPKSVRVSFEAANFDALMRWVDNLSRAYGVQATDLSADRGDTAGIVNARVTLEEP